MRWLYFILLQCLLVVIAGGIVYIHKDRVLLVKSPPASLAQWYKPENKRQVWLHNMFKLRREIQAVRFYGANKEKKHLQKWAALLSEHYLEIGEMVPQWKSKLNMEALISLQASVKNNRYQDLIHALDNLGESCESCHKDYRIITATTYRAPDFSVIEVAPLAPFDKQMKELIKQVNQIKIAFEDEMKDVALSSLSDLESGINRLGETCSACHKKEARVYPDDATQKTITQLEVSLRAGTLKEQRQNLGALAVQACARCHGTHRLAYDTKKIFTDKQSWSELMRH